MKLSQHFLFDNLKYHNIIAPGRSLSWLATHRNNERWLQTSHPWGYIKMYLPQQMEQNLSVTFNSWADWWFQFNEREKTHDDTADAAFIAFPQGTSTTMMRGKHFFNDKETHNCYPWGVHKVKTPLLYNSSYRVANMIPKTPNLTITITNL